MHIVPSRLAGLSIRRFMRPSRHRASPQQGPGATAMVFVPVLAPAADLSVTGGARTSNSSPVTGIARRRSRVGNFAKSICLTVAAWTGMVVGGGAVRAVPLTYDLAKDFSITANPHGAWSYGYETTAGTSFLRYTSTDTTYWLAWVGDLAGDRTPVLVKNDRSSPHLGVAPGQVALHPGPSGQPSIARFTAPNGIVSQTVIDGRFFPGDGGAMLIGIILNNDWTAPLFSAVDAGDFHVVSTLSAGDTIDFAVYGGYSNGTTPLDTRITIESTAVPEIDPAGLGSVAALVAGALGLAERRSQRGGKGMLA